MTLPCATYETFNVAQSGYSGTFSLVTNNQYLSVTPTTGTASQTFTIYDNQGNSPGQSYTVTATGANGSTGVLTVDVTIGDCG